MPELGTEGCGPTEHPFLGASGWVLEVELLSRLFMLWGRVVEGFCLKRILQNFTS